MTTRGRSRADRYAAVAGPGLLAAAVAVFLALKGFALSPQVNDDGIYFYAAARVAAGAVPYRDFFFAHPPMHLFPTALVFAALGYRWWLAKSLVFGLAALQGIAVYLTVRRLARDHTRPLARETAAVLGSVLLLSSETFLVASSNDTGLVQSSAWLSLAVALLVYGRPRWAGVCAALAATTSLQICPLVAALGLSARWLGPRRAAWELALVTGSVILVVQLLALGLAGGAFVDQVYRFHLAKIEVDGEGARQLRQLFEHNAPLLLAAAAGAASLAMGQRRSRTVALILVAGMALFSFCHGDTAPGLLLVLHSGAGPRGGAGRARHRRLDRSSVARAAGRIRAACIAVAGAPARRGGGRGAAARRAHANGAAGPLRAGEPLPPANRLSVAGCAPGSAGSTG